MERILADFTRMRDECEALLGELPQLRLHDKAWVASLAQSEAEDSDIVAHRAATAVA
jgi:hypothetical protein